MGSKTKKKKVNKICIFIDDGEIKLVSTNFPAEVAIVDYDWNDFYCDDEIYNIGGKTDDDVDNNHLVGFTAFEADFDPPAVELLWKTLTEGTPYFLEYPEALEDRTRDGAYGENDDTPNEAALKELSAVDDDDDFEYMKSSDHKYNEDGRQER